MGGSNPQVKSKEMIAQDSTSAKSTAKSKDESQSPRSKGSGSTVSRATKPPPICDHAPPQELYALKDTGNYLDHQLERKTYEESPLLGQLCPHICLERIPHMMVFHPNYGIND